MERDGYKNKYTKSRRAEATTEEYIVEIQTIKKAKDKKPKRLQVSKNIQEKTKAANSDLVEFEKCGLKA
jgi:hypothetical protein